ncbi:hypothetical protein C1645_832618 [Glomus cerebriforme]|uniref:Uncharacterized protein n=1 Tax=Glomus cerebriforme TaxID=658196 RepID=A0A397SD43_9GLOM|nr:hypothetical protein C1645_832618 [Glomus cerebriforme]
MSDETTSSYMCILNNFLAVTNNLAPKTIFSDCNTGLELAIESLGLELGLGLELRLELGLGLGLKSGLGLGLGFGLGWEFNAKMSSTLLLNVIAASSAIHVFPKLINNSDTSVCFEDCTDKCQIALKSLISGINLTNVIEIWEVKHMAVNTTSSQWYKKGVDLQKINILDNSASFIINTGSESSVTLICGIHNNEEDYLSNNFAEVKHFIKKRQIYGECAALE